MPTPLMFQNFRNLDLTPSPQQGDRHIYSNEYILTN